MMKRVAILLSFILLSVYSIAQKVIQMENMNGVYQIACSVNGAKMKMIFDTGASKVSLSESMANFLYDNDYITKEDILGTSKTQTADGSLHDNVVINIKDIEIYGLHLKDVQAVVISSQNAPLLLGQSAIQKLGHISLDGNRLIINDYSDNLSEKEINEILNSAQRHYNNKSYQKVIEELQKLIVNGGLSVAGYSVLVECCFKTEQYQDCINYGRDCQRKFRNEKPSEELYQVILDLARSYERIENYQEAIKTFQDLIIIEQSLGSPTYTDYQEIAYCYYWLEDWNNCIENSKLALKEMFKYHKTSEEEIKNKGIDDELIGDCLYFYAKALYNKNEKSSGDYIMILSARCNYDGAIEYCVKNNINYKSRQSIFD